jgi:hypothetical protein
MAAAGISKGIARDRRQADGRWHDLSGLASFPWQGDDIRCKSFD